MHEGKSGFSIVRLIPLLRRALAAGLLALALCCKVALLFWATLAIHWSNLPSVWLRMVAAAAFLVVGGWLLFVRPTGQRFGLFAALFSLVLMWWALIQPSHDRAWRSDVAVIPHVVIDGDVVTLRNVRDFSYRSVSEFDMRYQDRTVNLSKIAGVDFFVSKWSEAPIAHTFVSFLFEDAEPICISIEARLEQGETYSALASCFKQAELIYIIGEERDIVGVRTHHRNERVWRYRTNATASGARAMFLSYLHKVNELADTPEFYHLLSNNCTVNIDRHASGDGRVSGFDVRLLVNGWVDAYAYAMGALDTSVPLQELRKQGEVTEMARSGGLDSSFSVRIRQR